MEYFVVAIRYPRRFNGAKQAWTPAATEAVVDTDISRAEVVSRVRSREYDRIAFIHHVHDDVCEDVTNSILKEAGLYAEAIPSWEDLRGCAPNSTGDLSSEAFVRDLRGEWS